MQSRPHVLVVTPSYPSPAAPIGGIFVREQGRAVMPHADVRVLALDRGAGVLWVERAPTEEPPVWRAAFPGATALWAPGILAAAATGLRAVCSDGWRPDLIHAHFVLGGFPAVVLGRVRRIPVVLTEHWTVFMPEDPRTLPRPLATVARFTFAHADLVLPVNRELEQALRQFGVETPMRVVPNCVDVDLFQPPATTPRRAGPARLLLVGLLCPQKGVDVLLRALTLVRADIHLDVIGDGANRTEYENLAGELGVAGRVVFHGTRAKPEIAEAMRAADLYVASSRFENNPVAVIEAQASGLPVVGTAVGSIAEMVGEDGLVVPPDNPQALAEAIDRALESSYDRTAIGRRAAGRFGAPAVGRTLLEIYDEVGRRSRG